MCVCYAGGWVIHDQACELSPVYACMAAACIGLEVENILTIYIFFISFNDHGCTQMSLQLRAKVAVMNTTVSMTWVSRKQILPRTLSTTTILLAQLNRRNFWQRDQSITKLPHLKRRRMKIVVNLEPIKEHLVR